MDLEGLTLDREVRRIRDDLSRKFADIIYNGMWFSPERELISNTILVSQACVSGTVRVQLYKGNVTILGRQSPLALYDPEMSSVRNFAILSI
jgi:argininosuccinate synthase